MLKGGETLLDGEFRVEYTPGHASHHVCYLHEPSQWAFVGDMAGVAEPPDGFTLAPTPPPDIDVEAWERSLDTIEAWEPAGLGLTHFGAAEDAPAQLAAIREALRSQAALIDEVGDDQERFIAAIRERVEAGAGEDAAAILQAAPPDHLFLGLAPLGGQARLTTPGARVP